MAISAVWGFPALVVEVDDRQEFQRLKERMPLSIDAALVTLVAILKDRVDRGTPTGIKYIKFGETKTGKAITKKAKRGSGRRYHGKWEQTAELKRSWVEFFMPAGAEGGVSTIGFSSPLRWAGVLEEGDYPGIGKPRTGIMSGGEGQVSPRTVAAAGGIFSSRAVGGIGGPIAQDQRFVDQVVQTMAKRIFANLQGGF